jgi:hypothetical protein
MIETMDSSALTETRKYLAKSSAHAAVDIIKGGNSSKAKKTKAKNNNFKARVTTSTTGAKGVDVNINAPAGGKT